MDIARIKYLRAELDNECIDLVELSEIEEAFNLIPDDELRDLRENAVASDMLDELEDRLSPTEHTIYEYVSENYGESEANDPSWAIGSLAKQLDSSSYRTINNNSLRKFDEWLLYNSDVTQEDRETIIEFVGDYIKELK